MHKILASMAIILLMVSPVLSDEHEKRFQDFASTIIDAANRISWSSEYKLQDIEFVENEMLGDETVRARAWYDDYYVVIRKYHNKDWSSSHVSDFWTNSEELTFLNGIKVGSPFSKLEAYFGKEHLYHISPITYNVAEFEESDGGGVLLFSVENNRITSIGYTELDNHTSKMDFLFGLYASYYVGEVTAEKVNVREYAPSGKVKFQVSKSKGDRLLVEEAVNEARDWCSVRGRIINNTLRTVPYYYISKQFVKIRKLTPAERKLFISQYKK